MLSVTQETGTILFYIMFSVLFSGIFTHMLLWPLLTIITPKKLLKSYFTPPSLYSKWNEPIWYFPNFSLANNDFWLGDYTTVFRKEKTPRGLWKSYAIVVQSSPLYFMCPHHYNSNCCTNHNANPRVLIKSNI